MATVTKGKIIRSDHDLYDGTLATTRKDSTGGTIGGLKTGDTVDVLSVFGDGDTDNMTDATITKAINSLGSQNIALSFAPGTWTISNTITLASNFTVVVPAGCVFSVASGKTMTVQGVFFRQHNTYSSGDGTFTVSGTDVLSPSLSTIQQLSSVSGTNTITATAASTISAYAADDIFIFTPANDNTGAVTLNIDGVGAGAIQLNSGALVGGELQDDVPVMVQVTAATPVFEILGNGSFNMEQKGADIASNTALDVSGPGTSFDVTGTTTITSISAKRVGSHVTLQFDGALTLTHHATDLILPGTANITTAAGDIAVFYEYASGDWRCVSYTRASDHPNQICRIKTGSYTGDGGASQSITGVGFPPKYVKIAESRTSDGANGPIYETWDTAVDDNAAGIAFLHAAGGAHTAETNTIISLDSDGFTVDDDGSDADPNTNGTTYNYLCLG